MSVDDGAAEAVAFLRQRGFPARFTCAIVLGSGFGQLASELDRPVAVPYADIPHFPATGVSGHSGRLVAGRLSGHPVLLFAGRSHHYETGRADAMRVPIAVAAALGQAPLLLTNASGSIRPEWPAGRLVALTDHLAFAAPNPLIGPGDDRRFVPMVDAYDPALRVLLAEAALAAGVPLGEGVYMWFSGPSFETPAEIRAARALGADLVGMSTVPEVILARFYGLRVAALSVVTNFAAGLAAGDAHGHADTMSAARASAPAFARLVRGFVARLADEVGTP